MLGFVRFVIAFYIIYQLVTTMLVASFSVASNSMRPAVAPGDHVLVAPIVYGAPVPFTRARLPAFHKPRRGAIVLVRPAYARRDPWYIRLVDPVAEFFTGQTAGLGSRYHEKLGNALMLKRIVGIPGDTVEVRSGVVYIKPAGASVFSSELELIHGGYDIGHPSLPKGWNTALPLSDSSGPLTLVANQYFVVGDNRGDSSDSTSWGPVSSQRIIGKVFFRYWPLAKLGSL